MTLKELENISFSALKNGSTAAFDLCFEVYFTGLCTFANKLVRDPNVAQDIVQELFVNLWIQREQLEIHTSLKSFLFQSVKNNCLDHIKHSKVAQAFAFRYINENAEEYENIYSDYTQKEIQKALDIAVAKLPKQCKTAFLMSRFEYKSYKEIAEEMDLSVKTIENHIGRALHIIRLELKEFL
jgi:RNA polymerase sigma-70 factor (ECF subfamily)